MYSTIAKVPERKKTKHGIGKSGDELILSAQSDERARNYLGDMETPLPEKMSFHEKGEKSQNEKFNSSNEMKTVRKPLFSKTESQPKSAGKFELDTGWVELGYDEEGSKKDKKSEGTEKSSGKGETDDKSSGENKKKKGNIFISYQSNYDDDDARQVKDSRAKRISVGGDCKIKSNDESFQTGAEYMQASLTTNPRTLRGKWERLSELKGNKGTYDDVAPFHQSKEQQEKIDKLRETARGNENERTEIQKAITGVQTYKNKKDAMKRNFNKEFDREVEKLRSDYNKSIDDFWLFLKKKREEETDLPIENPVNQNEVSEEESLVDEILNAVGVTKATNSIDSSKKTTTVKTDNAESVDSAADNRAGKVSYTAASEDKTSQYAKTVTSSKRKTSSRKKASSVNSDVVSEINSLEGTTFDAEQADNAKEHVSKGNFNVGAVAASFATAAAAKAKEKKASKKAKMDKSSQQEKKIADKAKPIKAAKAKKTTIQENTKNVRKKTKE